MNGDVHDGCWFFLVCFFGGRVVTDLNNGWNGYRVITAGRASGVGWLSLQDEMKGGAELAMLRDKRAGQNPPRRGLALEIEPEVQEPAPLPLQRSAVRAANKQLSTFASEI